MRRKKNWRIKHQQKKSDRLLISGEAPPFRPGKRGIEARVVYVDMPVTKKGKVKVVKLFERGNKREEWVSPITIKEMRERFKLQKELAKKGLPVVDPISIEVRKPFAGTREIVWKEELARGRSVGEFTVLKKMIKGEIRKQAKEAGLSTETFITQLSTKNPKPNLLLAFQRKKAQKIEKMYRVFMEAIGKPIKGNKYDIEKMDREFKEVKRIQMDARSDFLDFMRKKDPKTDPWAYMDFNDLNAIWNPKTKKIMFTDILRPKKTKATMLVEDEEGNRQSIKKVRRRLEQEFSEM